MDTVRRQISIGIMKVSLSLSHLQYTRYNLRWLTTHGSGGGLGFQRFVYTVTEQNKVSVPMASYSLESDPKKLTEPCSLFLLYLNPRSDGHTHIHTSLYAIYKKGIIVPPSSRSHLFCSQSVYTSGRTVTALPSFLAILFLC